MAVRRRCRGRGPGPRGGGTGRSRTRARRPFPPATTTSSPTARCATTSATCGTRRIVRVPRGLGRRAHRPALRRRDAPRGRVGERRRRSPSTRAATRRSRPTSPMYVEPGRGTAITVVVNNELNWQSIPPGFVEETPDGTRQQYFHDFFNYAGLHRSVWLYTTPGRAHQRRHRRHRAGRRDGHVSIRGGDDRRRRLRVRVALRDAEGAEVARADGGSGDAHRRGRAPLAAGRGLPLRACRRARRRTARWSTPTRCRSACAPWRCAAREFLINGEPFYFTGFGKHEDIPVRGQGPRRRRSSCTTSR